MSALWNTGVLFVTEVAFAVVFVAVAATVVYLRQLRRGGARTGFGSDHAVPSVGLLHPNAGAGGGGERVLWVAVETLMAADKRSGIDRAYTLYTKRYNAPTGANTDANAGLYTANHASAASPTARSTPQRARDARDTAHLLSLVRQQFNVPGIDPARLNVVYLSRTWLLDPRYYPRLTLFLQSFVGGLAVFWDVATRGATDVIVDTVGIPCSYWLFSVVTGCTVAAYVHYPVISSDMLRKVASRQADFNNNSRVASSRVLTSAKLAYYRAFASLYRWFGGDFATVVMTNSSWTNDHIRFMWRRGDTGVVFPPCGITRFVDACPALDAAARDDTIVSVGQFRPEKDHDLQLRSFARALKTGDLPKGTRLILVGGCRDEGDRARVANLRRAAVALGLVEGTDVAFEVSVPAARVVELLSRATVGLHTMRDEHFGIVVAEFMAAGAIAVAHNSAGPKRDIVVGSAAAPNVGYLADTEEGFAAAICAAFRLRIRSPAEWRAVATGARAAAMRFSDRQFASGFARRLAPVLALTLLPEEDDDGVKLCC